MKEELFQKAKEYISNPDIVVNLYDFSVVWLSPRAQKMSGYSEKELSGELIRITDIFGFKEDEAIKTVWKDTKTEGERHFVAKMKDGKQYEVVIHFFAFKFGDTPYRVGEIKKSSPIN